MPVSTHCFSVFFQFSLDIGKIAILGHLALELNLDQLELTKALQEGGFSGEDRLDRQEALFLGVHAFPSCAMDEKIVAAGIQNALQPGLFFFRLPCEPIFRRSFSPGVVFFYF
jgi:predicted DsbA family dithiol-disulfide isomerase